MASVILSVTVTDTANHPLTTVRDKLLIKWNYAGTGTSQDKINFIQAKLAQYIKQEYIQYLLMEAQNANSNPDVDIQ